MQKLVIEKKSSGVELGVGLDAIHSPPTPSTHEKLTSALFLSRFPEFRDLSLAADEEM